MALDQIDVDSYGQSENEMTVFDHIEELRGRIIKSLIAIIIAGIVCFIFNDFIFEYVVFGPTHDGFPTYRLISNLFGDILSSPPAFNKQAIGFGEAFVTSIKVSFVIGFIVSFPFVLYQLWQFIKPGLYTVEKKATRGVVFICSCLFLLGVSFGYFIVSPFAINFLMGYTIPGVENIPTLASYLGYMVMFTLPAGLIFELPIVIYFLAKLGLVGPEFLRTYRKHAFVIILLLAAVLTPPDIFTQFLIGVPLYILYEISILVAVRVEKNNVD